MTENANQRPEIHTNLEEKIAEFGMNWYGSMMRGELSKWIAYATHLERDIEAAEIRGAEMALEWVEANGVIYKNSTKQAAAIVSQHEAAHTKEEP